MSGPLLTLRSSQQNRVTLQDSSLTNTNNGLLLSGSGHKLSNVTVTCSASRSQDAVGIHVKASKAELSGVTVSGCGEGIRIEADGVKIKEQSRIFSNHQGIHILPLYYGTDIENTLIFANGDMRVVDMQLDAISLETSVPELKFFDQKNEAMERVEKDPVSGEIKFTGDKAVIALPVVDSASLDRRPSLGSVGTPISISPNGMTNAVAAIEESSMIANPGAQAARSREGKIKIEFFVTNNLLPCSGPNNLHARNQACERVVSPDLPLYVGPTDRIEVQIPAAYRGKKLVAIITDPIFGTLGMTPPLTIEDLTEPIFLVGVEPIIIPSNPRGASGGPQGGPNMEFGEIRHERAEIVNVDNADSFGGSSADTGAAPKACSLVRDSSTSRATTIWLGLWWVFSSFILPLLLRPLYVKFYDARKKRMK
ncbi:MAG: hypothetical protein HY540_02055 [Deltaproteobacteria bacterium]|nr:hypothetical protein [Deltaproteobacteria bacterium]